MDTEKSDNLDLSVFYSLYKDKLPKDFLEKFEEYFELRDWYHDLYKPMIDEGVALLWDLMMKHYPEFKDLADQVLLKYIGEGNLATAVSMYGTMHQLEKDFKNGEDASEKYPKLEEWRAFYLKKPEPMRVSEEERDRRWKHKTDEAWEQYRKEENRKNDQFFEWEQTRQSAFYEIIQPLVFKYLPGLNNIEGDYWVLFATAMRDIYEEWKSTCDHLQVILDYELPSESVSWDRKKFAEAMNERYPTHHQLAEAKRDIRIYGR